MSEIEVQLKKGVLGLCVLALLRARLRLALLGWLAIRLRALRGARALAPCG